MPPRHHLELTARSADAVQETLAAAALRAERAISVARVLFLNAILLRFLATVTSTPAKTALTMVPLVVGVIFSLYVLLRVHSPPKTNLLFGVSVMLDATVSFLTLLPNPLWPWAGYVGVLYMPDTTGIFVATLAVGFRLSPRIAVLGGVANLASLLGLVAVDRAVSGERFAVSFDTESIFAIFVVAFALLGFILALTTRRLVLRGAVAATRASRAEQGLGVVLADHHDLRSLLTSATLDADRLRQSLEGLELAGPGEGDSALLRQTAGRLADGLRQVGRIVFEVKNRALEGVAAGGDRVPVAVDEVTARVVQQVDARFDGVVIRHEPAAAPLTALVAGGEITLHRALLNVLDNACEGRDGAAAAEVLVHATRDPDHGMVTLRVRDNGPGFTAQQLAEPFGGTSGKPQGSGVGLAVVRGLVESSGGLVQVANAPEGGAVVTVSLPAG